MVTESSTGSKVSVAASCQAPLTNLFCRLQFPTAITDIAGASTIVYGRVFAAGVTDQSGVDDPDPRLVGELGIGDPAAQPSTWTWTAATPNLTYGPASPSYEAANDEYQATLVVAGAPGSTKAYAYRFSGDGGQTWTYCDAGDAGSSDGFTTPGVMTVAAPYFSQYIEGSGNNKAIEIYNPGTSAFSLTGCQLNIYSNGNLGASHINLGVPTEMSIAPGDVYALCNTGYGLGDMANCDQKVANANWNGNDALELACNGTTLDVFGQIGLDPGAAGWGTGNLATTDHTLLRICTTVAGDLNGMDAFDPATAVARSYAEGHELPRQPELPAPPLRSFAARKSFFRRGPSLKGLGDAALVPPSDSLRAPCSRPRPCSTSAASAEPTDPVVIGWWSYFTPEGSMYQVPTTDPNHPVTMYGDPDTYYYEPSGGHGLQDMNIPADVAWQSIIDFTLANTNGATLSPDFTIDTSSDLNQFTQAYFGWAFVLLYVPKDKYCDVLPGSTSARSTTASRRWRTPRSSATRTSATPTSTSTWSRTGPVTSSSAPASTRWC